MFAMIAGAYPAIAGSPDDALTATLTDQLEAGLGLVTDGLVRCLERDEDITEATGAWTRATDRVRVLIDDPEVPAPPVKAVLVGPLSTPGDAAAAVARVRAAIMVLHAAGAPVVQLDEPWSVTPEAATDSGRARASATWAALLEGVTGHVCLALPGGGPTALGAQTLLAAPFTSHLVDLVHGPDDWREVGRLPGERGVILGVADLRPGRVDTPEVLVWAARHAAAMKGRGLARVALTTCAGLESLPREVARARLARLAEAAALATFEGAELARRIDPRAVDARSAALGRFEPRRRAGRDRDR